MHHLSGVLLMNIMLDLVPFRVKQDNGNVFICQLCC